MSQTALGEFATREPEPVEHQPVVEVPDEPAQSTYECQTCGSAISADFVRVMCPDGAGGPETCPHCFKEGHR